MLCTMFVVLLNVCSELGVCVRLCERHVNSIGDNHLGVYMIAH